jgi:homoserine O-acetyltransferase
VTVTDWVRSQSLLADHLGIKRFAAVVGGSLGGMQALEWAVAFPDRVRRTVAIAVTSRLSAQNIAFNEVGRQAILQDPDLASGSYDFDGASARRGLQLVRMLAHITYTSAANLERKFGRRRCSRADRSEGEGGFQMQAYLARQGERFAQYFDVHSYLRITRALDDFDIARDYGDGLLSNAMHRVKSDFLLIAFTDDWRFSPECSREIEGALRANAKAVSLHEISGAYGHDGFLLDDPAYLHVMRTYFASIESEDEPGSEAPESLPTSAIEASFF